MIVLIRKKPVFATQAIEDKMLRVAYQVWQQIGSDILQCCCDDMNERATNEGAYEAVFDANRPSFFYKDEGKEVEGYFSAAIKQHGYAPVLRAFGRARPLV